MAVKETILDKQTIHDASTAEILAFAKSEAGLTFPQDVGREYVVSKIFEALEWDAYKPEDEATHVVINLPISTTEKSPYQGGLNGTMFTIKRGLDVEISIGQFNTMVEAAEKRFRLMPLGTDSEIREGSPAAKRIPLGALDMRIVRFLNKGKKA